jgi:hypothetical protein
MSANDFATEQSFIRFVDLRDTAPVVSMLASITVSDEPTLVGSEHHVVDCDWLLHQSLLW